MDVPIGLDACERPIFGRGARLYYDFLDRDLCPGVSNLYTHTPRTVVVLVAIDASPAVSNALLPFHPQHGHSLRSLGCSPPLALPQSL